MKKIKQFHAKNIAEWRKWLEKNHLNENIIALVKYKKRTGKPFFTHKELMDEAICFGWIDTTVKRLDDEKYIIHFAKRSKNSRWSNATLSYAKKLVKEKRMAPHGLKMYKEGLKKPTLDLILPENHFPEDLKIALERNPIAKENFHNLAPSYKRNYIRWIERVKKPEARVKRIKAVIENSINGKKLMVG